MTQAVAIPRTQFSDATPASAQAEPQQQVVVEPVTAADLTPASPLYQNWLRLFEEDEAAVISQHPDHVCEELIADPELHDGPAFAISCLQDHGPAAIAVLLPKLVSSRKAGAIGPSWIARGFRLAGSRIIGDQAANVHEILLTTAAGHVRRMASAFLLIEDLENTSPLWQELQSLTDGGFHLFSPTGIQNRLRIRFPDNAEEYWSGFSRKTRSGFRRKIKKFGLDED